MIRWLVAAVALVTASPASAEIERAPSAPVRVQLDAMPLGGLVTLLMRDVMRVPYSISPDVLSDGRPVSVSLVVPRNDLPVRIVRYLRGLGLVVELNGGTVFVSKRPMGAPAADMGSPLDPSMSMQPPSPAPAMPSAGPASSVVQKPIDGDVMLVRLAHRSPAEIAPLIEPLFPMATLAYREGSAPRDGETIAGQLEPDVLALTADGPTLDRIEAFVRAMDQPRPVVSVRGVVLQVASSSSSSSALSVLASVLGGRVQVQANASTSPGDTSLRIVTGGLNAVLSAVKGDGRFKVVAEPALSVSSGSVATLNSGSQVPTLGAVTYTENGAPIRSVVYRDSGVTLTVRPVVRLGEISMDVTQERSSFAKTQTGQDETPTLNRASVTGRFALSPGDTVAFASLEERTESDQRSGLFGGLFSAKSRDKSDAQLIVLLQADVSADRRSAEPDFQRFPARGVGVEPLR